MSTDLTKKSGVFYLGFFLLAVCAIATALMAAAKLLTDEPIAAAKANKTLAGLKVVLEGIEYNNNPAEENIMLDDKTVYIARKDGKTVAYVMQAKTGIGYGGNVEGLLSFTPDGKIRTFIITKHNETPGIGTKVTDRSRVKTITDMVTGKPEDPSLPGNPVLDSFAGKKADTVKWTKNDVHFISGATVSSNAVTDLAWNASKVLNEYLNKEVK